MKKRAASGGVQMFSFLDAMVCTLGALLVLLHAFARDRENDAVKKADAKAAEASSIDVKAELETLEWRIEQLREVRVKTEAQLADERLRLAHVEDHERRLQEKFKEFKIAATEMERLSESKDAKTLRNQAELEAARIRLAKAKDELDEAREDYKHAASYNVVPYEGPNGTRRRPVYIECREESMILQPEGVELVPEDFAGFLGAGNPLASALRGTREYYARAAMSQSQASEPYPLLLVRPEGIMTYYAARSALGSWGADFGYELVGSDWQLKFPERDERLAQLLRQIVSDARMRMRELMVVTGQLNSKRQKVALRASANGGFVTDRRYSSSSDGGGSGRGSGPGSFESMESSWLSGKSSKAANRSADASAGSGGLGSDHEGTGGFGNGGMAPGSTGIGSVAGSSQDPRRRSGSGGNAVEPGARAGTATGGGLGNEMSGHGNGPGESPSNHGGAANDLARHGAGKGNSAYGAPANGQPGGQYNGDAEGAGDEPYRTAESSPGDSAGGAAGGPSKTQSAGRARSSAGGAGDGTESGQQADGANGQANANAVSQGSASSGGGASSSGEQSQSAMPHVSAHGGDKKAQSLAKRRGRDWGLQDAEDHMSAVTRPVLVQCYGNKLVIVPEDRTQQPLTTPLDGAAEETIDEFVVNVWKHTKQWGIAGKGLFWKPTLVMDVAPGGNDRYAEIQSLLADSGLDVRRRSGRGAATAQPSTNSRR